MSKDYDQAMEPPICEHYWAWVFAPDLPFSLRICQFCSKVKGSELTEDIDNIVRDKLGETLAPIRALHKKGRRVKGIPARLCRECNHEWPCPTLLFINSYAVDAHDQTMRSEGWQVGWDDRERFYTQHFEQSPDPDEENPYIDRRFEYHDYDD